MESTAGREKKILYRVRGKTVEINITNLRRNIRTVRSRLQKGTKLFPVIKSNAYGHGIENVVRFVDSLVDGWCAMNMNEALTARRFSKKPIILLKGTLTKEENEEARRRKIIVVVKDQHDLREKLKGRMGNLMLKIDTGMGRLGILPSEIGSSAELIKEYKGEKLIQGVMSHFSYSDFGDMDFILEQNRLFDELSSELERTLGKRLTKTLSNSAGTLLGHDLGFHKDIVRPGICIYGISPFGREKNLSLRPVMSVKTRVLAVKEIPAGWTVGYSRRFVATESARIAILDMGYADGIPRRFWEKGYVSIKGRRFKVIGVISMDMMCTLCDDSVRPGDEVQIIGDQIDVYEVAEKSDTIPYEILCSLGIR